MSTELATIEIKNPALVFVAGGGDTILNRIREEVRKEQPNLDISTVAGRKAIASLAYKIAQSKTNLDNIGKTLTDDQRAAINAVNAERARMWKELETLQEEVRAPLTAWEDAEKNRVEDHENKIKVLASLDKWEELQGGTPTAADVLARLDAVPRHTQRDWQEFSKRATDESDRVMISLQRQLSERQKAESEAAELSRLRAEEEECRIKQRDDEIAAKAKKDAEDEAERQRLAREKEVERERKAAAQREEKERQDKLAAEERARQAEADKKAATEKAEIDRIAAAKKAEQDRIAAEEAAAQRERDRIAAETETERKATEARENDKKHKAKINREALDAIREIILAFKETGNDPSQAIVEAIARGKVPHVKISY